MNADALRLLLFTMGSNQKSSPHICSILARCPPCRSFSPILMNFYQTCKDDGVEIIFVSSDRDDKSFNEYFGKMPWLSMVPGYTSTENRDRQSKLANQFKIQGIPSVIVLDAKTGNFISDNGRNEVMQASSSDETKKSLVQTWLSKEAVPIDQAVLGATAGESQNVLVRIFLFFARKPVYMFAALYVLKRFLLYLEKLGKEGENEL